MSHGFESADAESVVQTISFSGLKILGLNSYLAIVVFLMGIADAEGVCNRFGSLTKKEVACGGHLVG